MREINRLPRGGGGVTCSDAAAGALVAQPLKVGAGLAELALACSSSTAAVACGRVSVNTQLDLQLMVVSLTSLQ